MIWLVYDGDCPFCARYAEFNRIKQRLPDIQLVDARANEDHPAVAKISECGYLLDEGMALVSDNGVLHGAEALAALADPRSLLAKPRSARLVYPLLRYCRNLALRGLGRKPLGY